MSGSRFVVGTFLVPCDHGILTDMMDGTVGKSRPPGEARGSCMSDERDTVYLNHGAATFDS